MLKRILAVDDDPQVLSLLKEFLSQRYETTVSSHPQQTLDLIKRHRPDLIILDVDMPQMNGFELLEQIRALPQSTQTPVLFLTAGIDVERMQDALRLGANDYLTKPFRLNELLKRLESRLGQSQTSAPLSCGNLTLDPAKRSATMNRPKRSKQVYLTQKGLSILRMLIRNEGTILSRSQIMDWIWGSTEVSDRAVDLQIFRLRRLLKAWDHEIKSFYGSGYGIIKK